MSVLDETIMKNRPLTLSVDIAQAKKILEGGLNEVIAAEPEVTRYDTAVGDGDCGIGLKRGAEAILSLLNSTKANDAAELVDEIVRVVETNMDGTSGALYAIYLNALATGLRSQGKDSPQAVTAQHWGRASDYALQSMSKYTPAKPGDRTLVDALAPFVSTLQQTGEVAKAAKAAEEGSAKTKGMQASLGRTVYVGDSSWQEVPDPGAYGLAKFFTGLAAAL